MNRKVSRFEIKLFLSDPDSMNKLKLTPDRELVHNNFINE